MSGNLTRAITKAKKFDYDGDEESLCKNLVIHISISPNLNSKISPNLLLFINQPFQKIQSSESGQP